MKEKVRRYIERQQLLRPGERVGIAVSGGPDSVALLRVLLELREELGIVLSVLHFNHKIRGGDADEDERFVRDLAAKYDIETHFGSADVPAQAARRGLSLETAARILRYAFFRETAAAQQLHAVATGHTVDDQAETVLMNLVRGAGTQGLAGIFPQRPLGESSSVVRPLLSIARAEVCPYLESLGQPWREDATNLDLKHTRNRIRHEVVPRLTALNPRLAQTLADTAELARAEQHYWDKVVAEIAPSMVSAAGGAPGNGWALDVRDLQRHSLALQRRIVHHFIGLELEFDDVEAILDLAAGSVGRRRDLHHGYAALRRAHDVLMERSQPAGDYQVAFPVPGEAVVSALRSRFRAIFRDVEAGNSRYNRARLLEPQSLARELVVRNWRPGDRFWPVNTKAPEKVKRLLQERHITGAERALWPVVASGAEIVWMRACGVSQTHGATGNQGIAIEEQPLDV